MRYADLLLIHAEASMELGDEAASKSSLALNVNVQDYQHILMQQLQGV